MIAISKEERLLIEEKIPDAHVVRTNKQKSKRHHYFCEESKEVMALLKEFRAEREKGSVFYEGE